MKQGLELIREEIGSPDGVEAESRVNIIEYPYKFNDIIVKISDILKRVVTTEFENNDVGGANHLVGNRLLSPELNITQKLNLILKQIDEQWAFPYTVIQSLQIIGDEKSCCRELAKCIGSDVAATTSILNVANKVDFAGRYGRVANVQDAVVRMGFDKTKNVLALLTLIDISSMIHLKHGFSRSEFWMHSLATAIISDMLCKNLKYEYSSLGFVAGLIHDLGKIPMDNHFTPLFASFLEDTTTRIISYTDVEQENMGLNHADIGYKFTHEWDFPRVISNAILNHHSAEKIVEIKSMEERKLAEIVFVSNIFAKALSFGHSCDEVLTEIPNRILEDLKIKKGLSENSVDKIFFALKQYYEYLKVTAGDVMLRAPLINTKELKIAFVLGKNTTFHPIMMSLKFNGYHVSVIKESDGIDESVADVFIHIPDSDHPLDIILDDDSDSSVLDNIEGSILKIFLLDMPDSLSKKDEIIKGDFVLMDRKNIDIRFLLHVVEDFYTEKSMRAAGL